MTSSLQSGRSHRGALVAIALVAWAFDPSEVFASCNTIPRAVVAFDAERGAVSRPFAAPGEDVALMLRPCDDVATFPALDDAVISVAFSALDGDRTGIVFLSTDCDAVQPDTCGLPPDACRTIVGTDVRLSDGGTRLQFRFPDTDAQLAPAGDRRPLTGPAAIAVTRRDGALPCNLGRRPCSDFPAAVACVDELYSRDGSCSGGAPHERFARFTALPPANDFRAELTTNPPDGAVHELRAALDAEGNVLVPMNWDGVLARKDDVPMPRLVRARFGDMLPLDVSAQVFLGSHSPEGVRLPPIFEPQLGATPDVPGVVTLFGSADAPYTILRIARRIGTCRDGASAGRTCEIDTDCDGGTCVASCAGSPSTVCSRDTDCAPGDTCGSSFDASSLVVAGGPLVLPRAVASNEAGFCTKRVRACSTSEPCPSGSSCVHYSLEADAAVALDRWVATDELRAFPVDETVDGVDRDGDGDAANVLVTVIERSTGDAFDLGAEGQSFTAMPVAVVNQSPFRIPVFDADGSFFVGAFFLSNFQDTGYHFYDDATLANIYDSSGNRIDGSEPIDLAPLIDGKPLRVSNGTMFYRQREIDSSDRWHETLPSSGTVSLSSDGKVGVFTTAEALDAVKDKNGVEDVYYFDRRSAPYGLARPTVRRVSIPRSSSPDTNGRSYGAVISADGSTVAFISEATNLESTNDGNPGPDVFVRRLSDSTVLRASRANSGGFPNGGSTSVAISADGWIVAYESAASNLVANDANGSRGDIFVRDLRAGSPTNVLISSPAGPGDVDGGTMPSISGDGRYVAYVDLTSVRVQLFDRQQIPPYPARTAVSPSSAIWALWPAISLDGNTIAYAKIADGEPKIEVYDRRLGTYSLENRSSDGALGDGPVVFSAPTVSADGRFVGFQSTARLIRPPLMGGGENGLYVRDRLSGAVRWAGAGTSLAMSSNGAIVFTAAGQLDRYPDRQGDNRGNEDGDIDDTVLRIFNDGDYSEEFLGLADRVAVAAGAAAFLWPEQPGSIFSCSLNLPDVDCLDKVVHFWGGRLVPFPPEPTINLRRAATDVVLSDQRVAALVSEPADGNRRYNCDDDTNDTVVQLHPRGPGDWTNTGQAADALAISGTRVAFLTPEAAQAGGACGAGVLNADGDADDRVLQVWDDATGQLHNLGYAAEDFVLGERTGVSCGNGFVHLVAFRASELAQGRGSLNAPLPDRPRAGGDADQDDDVLLVYDFESQTLVSTGQAVTPCRAVACDPSKPYHVAGGVVRFLTREDEQSGDLDGNGVHDEPKLVVQAFDFCSSARVVLGSPRPAADAVHDPLSDGDVSHVSVTQASRCVVNAEVACAGNDECPSPTFCSGSLDRCVAPVPGTCRTDGDCPPGSTCEPDAVVYATTLEDADDDGVPNDLDVCAHDPDSSQRDADADGLGDGCDALPGRCGSRPVEACETVDVRRSKLQLRDKPDRRADTLKWTVQANVETAPPDPVRDHTLCVYTETAGAPSLVFEANAAAEAMCGKAGAAKSCWKPWRAGQQVGARYKMRAGAPDGLRGLGIKPGVSGRLLASVAHPGIDPDLPLGLPVTVQMRTEDGGCWQVQYDRGTSDATSFTAAIP